MSASSYLLTVLGEFVLPNDGTAWTSTILRSLELAGVNERAGRQAILRAGRDGWIETERVGRQARCHLTDEGRQLLEEGAARIYHFGRQQGDWDGQWLLAVTSTEPARDARHRLRTRMAWCGLGQLAPGVWISPDPSREKQVVDELARLDLDGRTFVGLPGLLAIDQATVAALWDLDALADRYDRFLTDFRPVTEGDATKTTTEPEGSRAIAGLIDLVESWRRFPLLDPELPAELLPDPWPGTEAAELFAHLRQTWSTPAQGWWQATETA